LAILLVMFVTEHEVTYPHTQLTALPLRIRQIPKPQQ
jgi:hypothetical protein